MWQSLLNLQAGKNFLLGYELAVILTAQNSNIINNDQLRSLVGDDGVVERLDKEVTAKRVESATISLEEQADGVIAEIEKESMKNSPIGKELSLKDTLSALFESKEESDWTITVSTPSVGQDSLSNSFAVHSFVLYARWPYFQTMSGSNLTESRTKCLTLPSDLREGGLTKGALLALLKVIYCDEVSSHKPLDLLDGLSLQCNCELYQLQTDMVTWFDELIRAATLSTISASNCVAYFTLAKELQMEWLATEALSCVVENWESLPKPLPQIVATAVAKPL